MVVTITTSIEVSNTFNIGNTNLVSKVLELREGECRSFVSSHIVKGVKTSTTTNEINSTESIEVSDNAVSEVLEMHVAHDIVLAIEVHETHTSHVEFEIGRWARSTGSSIERNTACSNGSTDADHATTG